MLPAKLESSEGELPARRLATVLGAAIVAGALAGILMLKEQAIRLLLVGLLVQLAMTMLVLTPADFAKPASNAINAAGFATNAGPLPTEMSVVPTIVATAGAGTGVVEEVWLG